MAAEPALRWWADFVSRVPDDQPVPLDAIPRNIIVDGPKCEVIDREWYLAGLSKEAVLARGVLILVAAIVAWVRAANHEWVETEHGPHDDGSAH